MFTRVYGRHCEHTEIEGASTAEVHFDDGRVVQITCAGPGDPRGDGTVMLAAFPPNGTSENGGANIDDVTVLLRLPADPAVDAEIVSVRCFSGGRKLSRRQGLCERLADDPSDALLLLNR